MLMRDVVDDGKECNKMSSLFQSEETVPWQNNYAITAANRES
jgi:hypothetical protein